MKTGRRKARPQSLWLAASTPIHSLKETVSHSTLEKPPFEVSFLLSLSYPFGSRLSGICYPLSTHFLAFSYLCSSVDQW